MSDTHKNYLQVDNTLKGWLLTVDHKKIGIMYLVLVLSSFCVGGVLGLLIRLEHMWVGDALFSDLVYNRLFTMHGIVMIFLFIIPGIPASIGNIILPLQLGAKDVVFPKVNLLSWYLYTSGLLILLFVAISGNSVDTGWTFYPPYSYSVTGSLSLTLLALFLLGFSSILTGLNFMATIHHLRAPGLTWLRMPLFSWSLYATSLIQVLATPVVGMTLVLLMFEKIFNIGIFDPSLGGDPILFEHLFWFYSHPAVYIMILPGMGVISDVLSTFTRKEIFGYVSVVISSISIAIISFLVWGHHLFVSGQSEMISVLFSFLTFFAAIPSGMKMFNWLATLYQGKIILKAPMIYCIGFLLLFTVGGLTGVFLAILSVDVHLHDTYFVVAHFHYVMLGGTGFAFFAGLFYWWPKMTGLTYSDGWAKMSGYLSFIGFNITFFTQFLLGTNGMPRRYHYYISEYIKFNHISSFGSFIMAFGFTLAILVLLFSIIKREKSVENPWNAVGLEWTHTSSPPIEHNFIKQPTVNCKAYQYNDKS